MAPARVALQIGLYMPPQHLASSLVPVSFFRYSPIDVVGNISAPVLFITAKEDDLCPPDLIHRVSTPPLPPVPKCTA
jgi:hypothetical protein